MPAPSDVSIHIEAEDRSRQAFRQAEQSVDSLERQTRELQGATRSAAAAVGLLGNEAQESAVGVTNLGRSIFRTSAEAKQFGGVFQDQNGRLREANGTYAKTDETVEKLGRTFQRTGRRATGLGNGFTRASGGANILTRSVGSLGGVLGALGIAAVTHEIGRFGITSIKTAGQLDQLQRALVNIEGSSESAQIRFESLIEIANRPGLQLQELVQYSNRLSAAGIAAEDVDKILLTVGETVVSLGGTAATSALAMEQLIQAFQLGKVDFRDFRTIVQQIPGFLEALGDVHGVEKNIDGLHEAFARVGNNMRDLVIPVFDELAERFEAPPDDSYIVVMDTLENSFKLFQGAVGDLFLPTVINAAMALSEFFEAARAGLKDIDALPEPIRDIVLGAKELYEGFLEISRAIESNVGPEIRELLPALATLLGSILDLAGSIANVLAPAYDLLSKTTAVMIALITKLAQDITSIIGVLTDFVDWISSAWKEEDRFTESTQRVTQAIEEVKEAATGASGSFQEYAESLRTVLEELASVNVEIDEKTNKLEILKSKGLEPTDASVAQIVRRIALLEERSKSLTASLPDLSQALEDVNAQLEQKRQQLNEMVEGGKEATESAEQLTRQIETLKTLASLLNVQIAQTTTELTETAPAAETATQAIENYSLTLARLKAEAEDARDTLSNTIDFQKLGENYQAAIAASDAYYLRQIANAQAALAAAEADSDEYFKIETNLFKLQRDQAEARKKLTEQASKVGETEAERRVEIAEKEHERLRGAGEETARALEASEKRRTAAAEAEQKRLTQVHQQSLKTREEAERAANQRSIQDSQERLSALQNAFENAVPESVDRTYENIQQATVAHYETLKNQARQRITDEDALNAELVSLDRQRNASLEDNHRNYLQRIANDAKNLLGERTDAFKSASDEILHNWERTVSDFERQLREADTEDALRAIESDFETAQQQMLASLESVLTELGFTADETAKIMQSIFRTAEGEADGFADKVISAFQRLGKQADRETKQQNRQIERNYRELVSEIEHILSNITDFFIDITRGGDIEDAFRQLGERVAESFLDVFTRDLSENLAASLSSIASETDLGGAASGGTGAGGAIQAAGGLSSILTLITSPVALAAIVPAVVFAATKYIGDKVGQTGVIDNPNRQGRPIGDQTPSRRRGETQSAYESRLRAREEAEAAIAERETFFGNYDPRAPFGRAIQESGVFTGDSGYFAEHALRLTDVDVFGNVDLPGLVTDLEGILQSRVEGLGTDMERAAAALDSAQGADIQPALQGYLAATGDFYQTQIDFANLVRRTTGHLDFGDVEGLSRQLQDLENQARQRVGPLESSNRYNLYQSHLRNQGAVPSQTNIDEYNALADAQGGVRYEVIDDEAVAAALQANQQAVEAINVAIANLENTVSQSNDPAEIASLLQQIAEQIPERYRLLREALQHQLAAGDITQSQFDTSIRELNTGESAALERNSDAMLANTIRMIDEGIGLINASITSIDTQIAQSNDPAEIAQLLSRVPDLIRQKYEMLRDALDARYNADEISVDVYNASLSELQSNESRDLEQHSDAVLANILRDINEDVQLIDSEISALQTQIDQLSEPTEIVALLSQIPGLITEKYQHLREALDEKYAAGEISVDVYNASLTALSTTETAETERHSDAVLAQTLASIDDDVELIDANIGALQLAVENSDDPEAIAGLLDAIKLLVADKYSRLRERLDELYAAEEISTDAYNAALTGLGTAESRALVDLDTQALNAISAEAQEQADFLNGAIENLRLSLQLTDDPTETQRILEAIKVLVGARFDVLIEELNALKDTLTDEQFSQALKGLELGKQVALENIDTEKFDAISAAAQGTVDFINAGIENLRLSLQLTDDPTETQQILDAIKVLTAARFQVLRDELNAIKDNLKPEEFEQALKGINLGEQLALENLDTEKFDAISTEADRQVGLINGNIENLRLSLQLTDDLTEQQQILDAIKTLTVARFRILRDELIAIQDSLKPEEFEQALKGLNLGEQLALENLNTEKFGVISTEAQKQVDFINGAINNLELALQLTDDPAEIQRILASIRTLTGARFDRLIQELKDLEESLDPAEFSQALEGLQLGKQVALKGIDERGIGVTLEGIGTQISSVDSELTQLFDELGEQTTTAGVREAVERLRTAITTKYQLMRDKINASAETEEEKARQIAGVDFQEGQALEQLGERGVGQFNSLIDTAQFLLDNATEAEFGTRRQALIDAINTFYDERIAFINGLDLSDTDRTNMLAVAGIQRNIALEAVPQMHESVTERLKMEQELQDDIKDLRDQEAENEADRLESIANLHERHNQRIVDLEEELNRDIEDLRRDRFDDAREDALDSARDLEDLQTEYARKLFGDSVISFGDLTDDQRRQLEQDTDYQREVFDLNRERDRDRRDRDIEFGDLIPGSAGFAFFREQLTSGQLIDENLIRELFGTQGRDDFLNFQQGTQDADQRLAQGILEATATYETAISENTAAMQALMFPEEAAAITKGVVEATESAAQATTGVITASGTLGTIVSALGSPAADLRATVEGLSSLVGSREMRIPGEIPMPELIVDQEAIAEAGIREPREIPTSIETLSVSANTVNVSGNISGGDEVGRLRNEQPIIIMDRSTHIVEVDKRELGRVVGEGQVRNEQRGDDI